jgi:hypothetical protein
MKLFKAFFLIVPLVIVGFPQDKQTPGQAVSIPGTKVSLKPPAGFIPASQFPGFVLEDHLSSIMITEAPGPFKKISAGFSDPSALKKKGISVLSTQQVKLAGQAGLLVYAAQHAFGTDILKWILIFGDEKESVLIVAAFPKEFEKKLSAEMKTSIFTASWDRAKNVSPTEGLNFTISEKTGLKFAKRVSNSLLFNKSGVIPSKSTDDPLFIVGQSISKFEIDADDTEEFSRSRILQNDSVTEIEIEYSKKMTIDNLNGYEILARGKDVKSGQMMTIYQIMLFESQSYYLMVGLVTENQRQAYLTVFKEMAESFKRKLK